MSLAKLREKITIEKKNGGSMKKMIVSLMLIISMFAFAAESAPSATVGYVKFTNVLNATLSDFNHITLPLTNGWTAANLIDPTSTNISSIAKYYPATQTYKTCSRVGSIWTNSFKTYPGDMLIVNAKTNHDMIVAGTLNALPNDSLLFSTTLSDFNHVMMRLNKTAITTSLQLATNMGGNISSIARWINTSQSYKTSSKVGSIWTNAFTDLAITQPLIVNATANYIWTDAKGDDTGDGEVTEVNNGPKAGNPRAVYIGVVDASSNYYDFSAAPYGNVTFKAWIKARPTDLLDEINTMAVGTGGYEHFGMGGSAIWFDISAFAGTWAAGDSLFVRIKDENGSAKAANEVMWKCQIDNDGNPIMSGLDDLMGAGTSTFAPLTALPISTPSSIEGNVPGSTKLYQNYPNPFNPTTTIKFDIAASSNVKLNVYNYNGQILQSLVNGTMSAGHHTVNFDASSLSAGVYYCVLEVGHSVMSNKMIIVK